MVPKDYGGLAPCMDEMTRKFTYFIVKFYFWKLSNLEDRKTVCMFKTDFSKGVNSTKKYYNFNFWTYEIYIVLLKITL